MTTSPFGRVLTAMVTPMSPGGEVDEKGTDALVDHLLDAGHDGIVVNGTTGESSTLSDDESLEMVRRVKQRAGDRAKVVAGFQQVVDERVGALLVDLAARRHGGHHRGEDTAEGRRRHADRVVPSGHASWRPTAVVGPE